MTANERKEPAARMNALALAHREIVSARARLVRNDFGTMKTVSDLTRIAEAIRVELHREHGVILTDGRAPL